MQTYFSPAVEGSQSLDDNATAVLFNATANFLYGKQADPCRLKKF